MNSISSDTIYNIIPFISMQVFPKNSHILKFGDLSKHFYCILSGDVSIRFPKEGEKTNMNKNESNNQKVNNSDFKYSEKKLNDLYKKYREIGDFKATNFYSFKNYFEIKKICISLFRINN